MVLRATSCRERRLRRSIDTPSATFPFLACAEKSCTSTFQRLMSRAEYILARKSDVWYFIALLIALVINLIIFFAGTINGESSLGCGNQLWYDNVTLTNITVCDESHLFHWVAQSWGPDEPSRAFGLELPGQPALAVRILTLLHFLFSTMMFIGWLAVPGRVLIGHLKARGSSRRRVVMEKSPYSRCDKRCVDGSCSGCAV